MIVRTYGRRNRCSYSQDSTFNESPEDFDFDEDQDSTFSRPQSLSQDSIFNTNNFSSSQDSHSPWDFNSQPTLSSSRPPLPNNSKPKKTRIPKNGKVGPSNSTSTLMEAQEFGEMMEHVDEVNFALDGLRDGQPKRIRRASLVALLSVCSTGPQRRLLRTNGMAKTILDAILSLSLDDTPSTLAAAALFYILASDGEDEQLLDSPICIRFLLKLLSPPMPITSGEKRPTVGCKLLALCRDPMGDQSKRLDASSTSIISKVQEILLSCKEIQSSNRDDEGIGRPELSPKWIALLTMEKACLSTVSIEDTSATVRKVGGNFKETLRELGGLDAVFDVVAECHSIMERWSDDRSPSVWDSKDDVALQTVVLLLKCLKIMENATFLSKDNQDHLLGMNGKSGCKGSSLSFTGLVISVIKILSGLSFCQSSSISSMEKSHCYSNGNNCASESPVETYHEVERDGSLSRRCSSRENSSHVESYKASQKRQKLSSSHTVYTVSNSDTYSFSADVNASHAESFKVSQKCKKLFSSHTVYTVSSSETSSFSADVSVGNDDKPSTSNSCNGTSKSSVGRISRNTCSPKINLGVDRRSCVTENTTDISLEDSQDPFAFDEDEFKPSKWDLLSTRKGTSQVQKSRGTVRKLEVGCNPKPMTSQSESNNEKDCHSREMTCLPSVEVGDPNLLSDCLLAAVKVLMNLTNDNPVGCNQIAACGGLETLSALISRLYPLFSTSVYPCSLSADNILQPECSMELQYENEKHFTDQELDFIVAILGLLVNLVEKDSRNRSRLAATSVSIPTSGGSERTKRGIIPLLCSIFLANQGTGEVSGEGKLVPWDDETAAVLEGEREAEKMIIEAYAALLLAFLSTESKYVREAIARCLPDHNLEVLVPVLERFLAFHLTLNMISPETHTAVTEVIESCKGV